MLCAVVPVRSLADGKRRLATALGQADRARLVLAMLTDVLDTLATTPAVARTLVVSSDPAVQQLAQRRDLINLPDPTPLAGDSLNAAVANALRWLREAGWHSALVVPGDVPFATAAELTRLAAAVAPASSHPDHGQRRLALAPDTGGRGSNALALAPPDLIQPAYGRNSAQAHQQAAAALALPMALLQLPGLALDLDTAADLARAKAHPGPAGVHTRAVLGTLSDPVHAASTTATVPTDQAPSASH